MTRSYHERRTERDDIMRSVSKLALFWLISFILSFAILVSLLEVSLRVFYPQFQYPFPKGLFVNDEKLSYRPAPNFCGKIRHIDYQVEICTNSHGLRDKEIPWNEKKDVKRILVLGDSHAMGYSVAMEDTFSKVLERKLNMIDPEWEVINAGVSGWGTIQEFEYLKTEGYKYKPDIIILAFSSNDFIDNSNPREYTVYSGYRVSIDSLKNNMRRIKLFFAIHSRAYRLLAYIKRAIKIKIDNIKNKRISNNPDSQQENDMWKATESVLKDLFKWANDKNVELIFFNVSHMSEKPVSPPQIRYLCEKNNVIHVDYSEVYKIGDRKVVYPHDGHLNALGNKLAAEMLFEIIKRKFVESSDLKKEKLTNVLSTMK
ncbi:MAG: SGNH/GDSL hydrolase family protein [bacterium]